MKRSELKPGVDYLVAERYAWTEHSREVSRVRVITVGPVERRYLSRGDIVPGKGSGVHVQRLTHEGKPTGGETIIQLQVMRGEWAPTWLEVQAYAEDRQRDTDAARTARDAAEKGAVAMVERAEAAGFKAVYGGNWQKPDRIVLTTAQLGALLDTIEHLSDKVVDLESDLGMSRDREIDLMNEMADARYAE